MPNPPTPLRIAASALNEILHSVHANDRKARFDELQSRVTETEVSPRHNYQVYALRKLGGSMFGLLVLWCRSEHSSLTPEACDENIVLTTSLPAQPSALLMGSSSTFSKLFMECLCPRVKSAKYRQAIHFPSHLGGCAHVVTLMVIAPLCITFFFSLTAMPFRPLVLSILKPNWRLVFI